MCELLNSTCALVNSTSKEGSGIYFSNFQWRFTVTKVIVSRLFIRYNEQEYIESSFKCFWNPIIIGSKTVGMVTAFVDRDGASIAYGQD